MTPPILIAAAMLAVASAAGSAQPPSVAEVEVVATAPLPGSDVPVGLVATHVQTLSEADLVRVGAPAALGALDARLTGVSLGDAQDNPFQPNLFYRGFQASPLAGDAQGLAVYLDGARFNQPFGDTVDWDLIPDQAISSVTLQGSNPVFGLNALGGSLAVKLKTGFTDPGAETVLAGGSHGQWQAQSQLGASDDGRAMFAAVARIHDDGWRDHSPSDLLQGYLDLGWKADGKEAHLKVMGADNSLTGNGPAPVELLAARRASVFTFPDETHNRYVRVSLSGAAALAKDWALDVEVYAARLSQRTLNGDASDVEPCAADPGLLCLDDDIVTDTAGGAVTDFLAGGPYGQLNQTAQRSDAFGGSIQLSSTSALVGRANHFILGAGVDAGRTRFAATSLLGALTSERGFAGPGVNIDQADGSIAPVNLTAVNSYLGVYALDVLSLTPALSISASARLNLAYEQLQDHLGTALNGRHHFSRFDPAVGATYRLAPQLTAYAGLSATNRAPTPAELSCAAPSAPCSLTNFFVADPDLKQVNATTFEAGLRGKLDLGAGATLRWTADAYRTQTHNDIIFSASAVRGRAFFRNAGDTRRQGLEASLEWKGPRLTAYLGYAFTDATFRSPLILDSPDNPEADASGLIMVRPGDRMPGAPEHRLKLGMDYRVTSALQLGATAVFSSGQVLFGDEANLTPKTRPYAVFGLEGGYQLTPGLELFGSIANLFDAGFETFGTFCPTSDVTLAEALGAADTRCLSPAAPRSVRGGLRARF